MEQGEGNSKWKNGRIERTKIIIEKKVEIESKILIIGNNFAICLLLSHPVLNETCV